MLTRKRQRERGREKACPSGGVSCHNPFSSISPTHWDSGHVCIHAWSVYMCAYVLVFAIGHVCPSEKDEDWEMER